jgi:hypothetical protein
MSKTYEYFYDEVLPYLPGCTPALAKVAIRNAVIDFCESSLIIQRDHDPVTVIASTINYDFEPPTGYLVVKIMRSWFKGVELTPTAPDELPAALIYNTYYPDAVITKADPTMITQKDERTYTLYPFPSTTEASALTMRVALKPTRSSTTIEDVVYEDYAEIIGHGAKYRLMSSPSKPFTSPDGAAASKIFFDEGVNAARQRASRGYVRSDLRVNIPRI